MTALFDGLADELAGHARRTGNACACGWVGFRHATHLAAVVQAFIGARLREEWGAQDPERAGTVMFGSDIATARWRASLVLDGQPSSLVHRLVSDWEPVTAPEEGDRDDS